MPRFLISRTLGEVSSEQLDAAAENSRKVRAEQFPEIEWEHSHVVRTDDGLKSYCVYAAPDEQMVRDHAAAAGLPADEVQVIEVDMVG
jgi:Nickel responsive protein SCO4226-like